MAKIVTVTATLLKAPVVLATTSTQRRHVAVRVRMANGAPYTLRSERGDMIDLVAGHKEGDELRLHGLFWTSKEGKTFFVPTAQAARLTPPDPGPLFAYAASAA